jgi:hypothetical protein
VTYLGWVALACGAAAFGAGLAETSPGRLTDLLVFGGLGVLAGGVLILAFTKAQA